jgi:hypothetical protein
VLWDGGNEERSVAIKWSDKETGYLRGNAVFVQDRPTAIALHAACRAAPTTTARQSRRRIESYKPLCGKSVCYRNPPASELSPPAGPAGDEARSSTRSCEDCLYLRRRAGAPDIHAARGTLKALSRRRQDDQREGEWRHKEQRDKGLLPERNLARCVVCGRFTIGACP